MYVAEACVNTASHLSSNCSDLGKLNGKELKQKQRGFCVISFFFFVEMVKIKTHFCHRNCKVLFNSLHLQSHTKMDRCKGKKMKNTNRQAALICRRPFPSSWSKTCISELEKYSTLESKRLLRTLSSLYASKGFETVNFQNSRKHYAFASACLRVSTSRA